MRLIVLALVPALIITPATAEALRLPVAATYRSPLTQAPFTEQALADKALGMLQLITHRRETITWGKTLTIAGVLLLTAGTQKLAAQEIVFTPEYRHAMLILFLKIASLALLPLIVMLLLFTSIGKDLIRFHRLHRQLRNVLWKLPALQTVPVTAEEFGPIPRGVYRIPARPTTAALKAALRAHDGASQVGFYRTENQWIMAITHPNGLEKGLPGDFSAFEHNFLFQFQSHTHPKYPNDFSPGINSYEADLDHANSAWGGYNHMITVDGLRRIRLPRGAGHGTFWEIAWVYALHMDKHPIPELVTVNDDFIRRNREKFLVDDWRSRKIPWEEEESIEHLLSGGSDGALTQIRLWIAKGFHRWFYEPLPNADQSRRQWRLQERKLEQTFWHAIPAGAGIAVSLIAVLMMAILRNNFFPATLFMFLLLVFIKKAFEAWRGISIAQSVRKIENAYTAAGGNPYYFMNTYRDDTIRGAEAFAALTGRSLSPAEQRLLLSLTNDIYSPSWRRLMLSLLAAAFFGSGAMVMFDGQNLLVNMALRPGVLAYHLPIETFWKFSDAAAAATIAGTIALTALARRLAMPSGLKLWVRRLGIALVAATILGWWVYVFFWPVSLHQTSAKPSAPLSSHAVLPVLPTFHSSLILPTAA